MSADPNVSYAGFGKDATTREERLDLAAVGAEISKLEHSMDHIFSVVIRRIESGNVGLVFFGAIFTCALIGLLVISGVTLSRLDVMRKRVDSLVGVETPKEFKFDAQSTYDLCQEKALYLWKKGPSGQYLDELMYECLLESHRPRPTKGEILAPIIENLEDRVQQQQQ